MITLTPAADFVGDLVATYQITDDDGLRASATATLTVLEPLNRAPIARDDDAQLVGGDVVDVNVLFNDDEPDGDPLALTIIAAPDPALGSAQVRPGGTIRFASAPGAVGTATIGYRIDDGELTSDAVLRVSILPCGQAPPEAPNVFLQTAYMQSIAVDLATYARNGTIVDVGEPLLAASGVITPAAGENGNIVFNYSVVNICRVRDTGTVTIDVNQDPVAQPFQTAMSRTQQRSILVSDLATDAEPLTISSLTGQPGWVTIADGGASLSAVPSGAADGRVPVHGDGSGPGRFECCREHPDRPRQHRAGRQRRHDRRLDRHRHAATTRQRHRSRRRPAAAAVVPDNHRLHQRQPGNGHGRRHRSALDRSRLGRRHRDVRLHGRRQRRARVAAGDRDRPGEPSAARQPGPGNRRPRRRDGRSAVGQRSRRRRAHRHARRRAGRCRGDDRRSRAQRDRTDRLLRLLVHVRLHGDRSVRAGSHRRRHDRRDRHTAHDDLPAHHDLPPPPTSGP